MRSGARWGAALVAALSLAACGEPGSVVEQEVAAQAAEQQRAASTFLADAKAREGVQETASGLLYEVVTPSSDQSLPRPIATAMVLVHYEGKLADGTVFDSSFQRGEPAEFPLNQVIPGWTEGVQLMRPGDEFMFYIPSELGYGPQGSPPRIPPNAPLQFRVQLLALKNGEDPAVYAPGIPVGDAQ